MDLIGKIEVLVLPLFEEMGLELVDVEYRREPQGWVLRFFLDKEGGINLDDCAAASRQISSLLDVEDVIPTTYNLEVSSPGLDRPLKKRADFERFTDHLVKIKAIDPIAVVGSDKRRKTISGRIIALEQDDIVIALQDRQAQVRVSLSNIDTAHLVPEF
ncbi:MAG: ribosome maturation factor RimP [Pelovirga sp.]